MKKYLLLLLFVITSAHVSAQSSYSPTLYLKSFRQELLKFKLKSHAYHKASSLNQKHQTITSRYNKVVDQLQRSRKKIIDASSFQQDNMLKMDYLQGINELITIYEQDYAKVEKLRKYRLRSHEDLKNFYRAVKTAEKRVLVAEKNMLESETTFSKRFKVRRTIETEEKALDDFRLAEQQMRELNLLFAKAHHMVDEFISMVEEKEDTELRELELNIQVKNLKENLIALRTQVEEIEENEYSEDLKKETLKYLKRSYKSASKVLPQVAKTLAMAKPNSIHTHNARIDLNFFSMDYNIYKKSLIREHKSMANDIFEIVESI